jgi:hypothetical protein
MAAVMWAAAITVLATAVTVKLEARAGKTLANDPLTGLPIIPSEDPLHLGNEPQAIDPSNICKSRVETDFYSLNGIKMDATVAWYAQKLTGFKKTEANVRDSVHVMFYKPDRTVVVQIVSQPLPGKEAVVHGITYSKLTPAPDEKMISGMNTGKIVCQ